MNSHHVEHPEGDGQRTFARLYLTQTFSGLSPDEKRAMGELIDEITKITRGHKIAVFPSLKQFPPQPRWGSDAQEIWLQHRKEMAKSHLVLFVHAGPSEGGSQELRNAAEHRVPVVILQRQDMAHLHELVMCPALEVRHELTYIDSADAVDKWSKYLKQHATDLLLWAFELDGWRREIRMTLRVGDTIRWLRSEIHNWTVEKLAVEARLPVAEIKAMEQDLAVFAPPVNHIAAVALALETTFDNLCLRPEEWLRRHVDILITQVAKEERLSVALMDDFRREKWQDMSFDLTRLPSKDEVRAKVRSWIDDRFGRFV